MRNLIITLLIMSALPVLGQVQITLDITSPICDGCCDGAVDLSVDGCMVGALAYDWSGPSVASGNEDLSQLCEAGIYTLWVTDANATVVQVEFEMTYGADPYTLISNEPIACEGDGGNLSDCIVYYFPPADSVSLGEACITAPPCWEGELSYLWWTIEGVVLESTACMGGLTAGEYTGSVSNAEGDEIEVNIELIPGASPGTEQVEVCPNALEESALDQIALYPNPAQERLYLELPSVAEPINYRVNDVKGKLVMQGRVNSPAAWIDLSLLEPGIYLLQLNGQWTGSTRFVKSP